MFVKSAICLALLACLCQLVASQSFGDSSTSTSTQSSSTSTGLYGSVSAVSPASNATGAANQTDLVNQAPVTIFLGQVLRGQVFGLQKCKKPKDCGLGMRCDLLMNLCVPFNTPLLQDIEKPCSNDSECSGLHACQGGLCRFCGPKSCRSNLDCCAGSFAQPGQPGQFYECLNTKDSEKLALAKQLGRVPANYQPMPKVAGGKSLDDAYEVESNELIQLGLPVHGDSAFHGKRCWARCSVDNDCYHSRTPVDMKQVIGCVNNVCAKRVPAISPQIIQQAQQLQQQRLQQQQMWNQQQALVGQVHSGQQSAWGAGGHHFQQMQPQTAQMPFQQAPIKPAPQSWQEAQQTGPSWQMNPQQQG